MSSLVYSLRGHFRRVEPEKLWTYILTTIVVLILYWIANQITIDEPRFDVEKFAEIDFTKFIPPKPKAPEPKKKPIEKVATEATPSTTAPLEIPEIDITALKRLADAAKTSPKELTPLQRIASLPQAMRMPEVNVGTIILPPTHAPVIQNNPGGMPVFGAPTTTTVPSLEAVKTSPGRGPSRAGYSTGRIGPVNGPEPRHNDTEKLNVKNFSDADLKKIDFQQLFLELLEWLKAHQSEFSPTVKRFLRYKNGDVTAKVFIPTVEASYDLFILCNEYSQDIGLLLVAEGDSTKAICLRDVGFRKQSFSLKMGVAGRNEREEVAYVSMREERPTLQETSRFYNIFLSWWDKNKKRKEQK
jgi:hypothetical protein